MGIEFGPILQNALGAATDAVKSSAPQVEDFLREIAKGHEAAIKSLADALADGDIDEETFKDEMDDEARTLQAELQVVAVISNAIAQRAINAFRKALIDGITGAIKAAL
ncbi:hypothetical protein H8N03_04915 [Ramlibacter sp. USB13]|uniref:Uncharacterized protein n=1 Tax=Ramlibacter cellulosilyticus TaxID=2764187 RepID=A0A923SA03_9BURK|nr:hypothetical protein [Ramlibacter cellulosilyticus]MBC5782275.1 hypothetical protein [Ramlibacter cellulosilyticus]